MIGQPAKVLRPHDVRRALAFVAKRRHGARNKTMILLSVKARPSRQTSMMRNGGKWGQGNFLIIFECGT